MQHKRGFVTSEELIDYLEEKMLYRGVELYGCTIRTLQRDFKKIQEIFGITIKHRRACGYYISDEDSDNIYNYEQMLLDFDLLTAIGAESKVSEYLIPEHHSPQGHDNIPA
ncbi:MAG: WYL domain-containing protein, partial [Muribaculaceae bacterium]|nr:WYL domain-containing protein [Muribaculaceae bacterium]